MLNTRHDPVLLAAYIAHIEAYEALAAELREDLAIRISNATWGEQT